MPRPGGCTNALVAVYLHRGSRGQRYAPTTPVGRTRPATAAFYNLFIPLSLRRSDVSEGKINFTFYLNVKSFGFDRISFQIVLINLLLRRPERAAVDTGTHYEFMRRVIVFCSVVTAVSVRGNNRFNWKSVNKFVGSGGAVLRRRWSDSKRGRPATSPQDDPCSGRWVLVLISRSSRYIYLLNALSAQIDAILSYSTISCFLTIHKLFERLISDPCSVSS